MQYQKRTYEKGPIYVGVQIKLITLQVRIWQQKIGMLVMQIS